MPRPSRGILPPEIYRLYRVFEIISNNVHLPYRSKDVREFLSASNSRNQAVNRALILANTSTNSLTSSGILRGNSKLMELNRANASRKLIEPRRVDLCDIINDNIQRIFQGGLDLGKLENYNTNELFNDKNSDGYYPFISLDPKTKNKSSFQAKISRTLISHYKPPLTAAPSGNSKFFSNSFKWFQNTLKYAPIIFFLKQEHRLFSSSMINQINKPLSDLTHAITQLSQALVTEDNFNSNDDILRRNYHLSDLADFDIFNAAVKSGEADIDAVDWRRINTIEDKLCSRLQQAQKLQVLDKQNHVIDNYNNMIRNYPLRNISKQLYDSEDIKDIFPFDLTFSTFNLLTIEDRIIKHSHQPLLDILHKFRNDFEIVAVRLSTEDEHIYNFVQHGLQQPEKREQTYETMLESLKTSNSKKENIDNELRALGQWGLTNVEEGCHNNCIYLFPQ